jgi:hypothetical protein
MVTLHRSKCNESNCKGGTIFKAKVVNKDLVLARKLIDEIFFSEPASTGDAEDTE